MPTQEMRDRAEPINVLYDIYALLCGMTTKYYYERV